MNTANVLAALAVLACAFFSGVWYEKHNTDAEVDGAVITALRTESKRTEEVVNGWNHAVIALRARLRNGDAPKIPVPTAPGTSAPSSGVTGTAPSGIPAAGELATCQSERSTCQAERARLIEDGALTVINCKALQQWAK